jgi:c-di-GMP-binding flagellar brake protein YcgR
MSDPATPLAFMKAASADGTPVCVRVAGTGTRAQSFVVSQDPRNGDLSFEVIKWFERRDPPLPGTPLTIEVRMHGVVHAYVATLVYAALDNLTVSRPMFMSRVQRRAWARVNTESRAWVRLRDEDGARVRLLRDVSAGGVGILVRPDDDDIAPGLRVPRVEFGLEYSVFVREGVVRRVDELVTARGLERFAGIEFQEVQENERDRIVSYVLRRERESVLERRRDRVQLP